MNDSHFVEGLDLQIRELTREVRCALRELDESLRSMDSRFNSLIGEIKEVNQGLKEVGDGFVNMETGWSGVKRLIEKRDKKLEEISAIPIFPSNVRPIPFHTTPLTCFPGRFEAGNTPSL